MFKTTNQNLIKKILPISLGVILISALYLILFTSIFKNPEKQAEEALILYKQQFAPLFSEEEDYLYNREAPVLEPVLGANNEVEHYQGKNSSFAVKIPAKNYQDSFIFQRKGYQLSIVPKGAKDNQAGTAYNNMPLLFPSAHAQEQPPRVYYLIYRDVYTATDVVKKIRPYGVKEAIILKSSRAPNQFEWTINVGYQVSYIEEGGGDVEAIKESDGSIRFFKQTNPEEPGKISGLAFIEPDEFLFRIPAPFMIDINGKKSTDCEWQLNKADSTQYDLTLSCNTDGMAFPLAIDPSIVDNYNDESKISATSSTTISSGQAELEMTSNWYSDTSWTHRKKITIVHTMVSESDAGELNFPMLVNLASDSDVSAAAQSDGDDFLFTSSDGETKLNHEIEKYDSDGDLVAWVNVPSLSSTSDTYLYMYYGNGSATDQSNATGTWNSDFRGVWHLNDDTTASISDSTSYDGDGIKAGANEPIETPASLSYDGQIGHGQIFDGNNDYIDLGDRTDVEFAADDNFSWSIWARGHDTYGAGVDHLFQKYQPSSSYIMQDDNYSDINCVIEGEDSDNLTITNYNDNTGDDETWHYYTCVREYIDADNRYLHIYIDGRLVQTQADTTVGAFAGDRSLVIGVRTAGTPDFFYNGALDEARLMKTDRSAYWISNEYNNMASPETFYTLGDEEDLYPSSGTITSNNLIPASSTVEYPDWYNGSWAYRKKITINSTVVSESDAGEFNFPVLVNLASDTDLAAETLSNGHDILFTSAAGTKLDHEIEKYEKSDGDLIAWVEIPSLSSTSDTEIYMYFGNKDSPNQQNVAGVWDSNYMGVWHLSETASNSRLDSTSNNNDGTPKGTENMDTTDGQVDGADDFDGSENYINVPEDSSYMPTNLITVEGWWKGDAFNAHHAIWAHGSTTQLVTWTNQKTAFSMTFINNGQEKALSSTLRTTDVWYYLVGTYDGSEVVLWVDATIASTCGAEADTIDYPATDLQIGSQQGNSWLEGVVDEVRISNIARSAYWISNTYNNIISPETFYTVGSLEQPAAETIDSFYYNATIPSGTGLEVQFSQNGSDWYSASGSSDWTSLTKENGGSVDLSVLGWTKENFYYRLQFNSSDGAATPTVYEVGVGYTAPTIKRLRGGVRLRGGTRLK